MKVIRVLVLTFAVLSSPSNAQETLTPARWMTHLTEDLLPFWMHPDALDDGSGMYPSMRCNDGSKFRRDAPCREIASVEWMTPFKNYVIAISRQAYAYGVAFHMTGDPVYLAHARRGVDVLMAAARDRDAGGHFEGFDQETGEWGPKDRSITLQKQAYALLGPAFYYYLTRDPAVLEMIRETRQMILRDHFDPATGFYTRFRQGVIRPRESNGRLVSYLDQLNTYYQQIAPLLAGEERADWIGSMAGIAAVIRDRFHVQKYNAIITNLDRTKRKPSRFPQSDFGHTIKSFWFLQMVGALDGDRALIEFAETAGKDIIRRSFLGQTGSWSHGYDKRGKRRDDKNFWVYIEHDQFLASLALKEPKWRETLARAYAYWLERFVDTDTGGVFNALDLGSRRPRDDLPKHWAWKSGFHEFEHALVAYITSAGIAEEPLDLYFAFDEPPVEETIYPYFYGGTIDDIAIRAMPDAPTVTRVRFSEIGFPRVN